MFKNSKKSIASVGLAVLTLARAKAQGVQGITAAESSLIGYVDPVASLCLVIGAVVGIIGGVRVYIKWNSGDQDINKELMGWGGSCLFMVLVSVVIKAFFRSLMGKQFSIYKGLQKPLMYKGFQGKFIGWGIASLVLGLVLGGLIGSLTDMVFGGILTIGTITGGLYFTSQQQKKGLHNKTRNLGVFLPPTDLKPYHHAKAEKNTL